MIPRWAKGLLAAAGAVRPLTGCGFLHPLFRLSPVSAQSTPSPGKTAPVQETRESLAGSAEKARPPRQTLQKKPSKKTKSDPCAIAYVSCSTAKDAAGVKILAVEKIAPSMEAIRNNSYLLTRNYYLCWNTEPTPATKDFLRYIDGAGQAATEKYAIPLGHPATFLSDQSAGIIRVGDSTSAAPLIRALAESHQKIHHSVIIEIDAADSSSGLTAVIESRADLTMSSWELKNSEAELLTKQAIAHDAVFMIVNEKNPLTTITKDQIKGLYDGTWSEWKDMK